MACGTERKGELAAGTVASFPESPGNPMVSPVSRSYGGFWSSSQVATKSSHLLTSNPQIIETVTHLNELFDEGSIF